jgi:hypothetical protein
LGGDFNVDINSNKTYCSNFRNFIETFRLHNVFFTPTYFVGESATCIDLTSIEQADKLLLQLLMSSCGISTHELIYGFVTFLLIQVTPTIISSISGISCIVNESQRS